MSEHPNTHRDEEAFSFGLAELRRAAAAGAAPATPARNRRPTPPRLQLARPPAAGFDPYNSTGGFNRNNAWKRIPKR